MIIIGYWLDMEIYVRVLVRSNIAQEFPCATMLSCFINRRYGNNTKHSLFVSATNGVHALKSKTYLDVLRQHLLSSIAVGPKQ